MLSMSLTSSFKNSTSFLSRSFFIFIFPGFVERAFLTTLESLWFTFPSKLVLFQESIKLYKLSSLSFLSTSEALSYRPFT